jgi:hypothetical protein|tara:strand:+ start:413 stop:592 length:180 start_codon:yes stop_codon:yes gene_type:complete
MKKQQSKIYDWSLVLHWDDDKDSWLGVNDVCEDTRESIEEEINLIFEDALDEKCFDTKE